MPRRKPPTDPSEAALFRAAVRDVRPLGSDREPPDSRRTRPVPARPGQTAHAVPERPAEAVPADLEHVRRSVPPRLLARLRRGQLRPEGTLDLHGMRRHEAELAVHEWLGAAQARGARCLLLVHGIGRSRLGGGVIREALPGWLECHPGVLAHCPAVPRDGGHGASYVLLRRLS
jgi:DNA-nicking Smr family endonuclease